VYSVFTTELKQSDVIEIRDMRKLTVEHFVCCKCEIVF